MANCKLLINSSQYNVVNKSIDEIDEIIAAYKEPCDMLNPVVIIPFRTDYLKSNYIYLSDFERYYFVEEITTEHQRLFLKCKVDVLMSFKNEIKACQGIARRNSNNYNLYLNDGTFKTLQYNTVTTHKFPNSFSQDLQTVLIVGG